MKLFSLPVSGVLLQKIAFHRCMSHVPQDILTSWVYSTEVISRIFVFSKKLTSIVAPRYLCLIPSWTVCICGVKADVRNYTYERMSVEKMCFWFYLYFFHLFSRRTKLISPQIFPLTPWSPWIMSLLRCKKIPLFPPHILRKRLVNFHAIFFVQTFWSWIFSLLCVPRC